MEDYSDDDFAMSDNEFEPSVPKVIQTEENHIIGLCPGESCQSKGNNGLEASCETCYQESIKATPNSHRKSDER